MPLPTISFLLGIVVLGYLLTFVVFAVLRIVTGVSIQRVGYSGFRRISFSTRNGIKVNIRGVGLSIHRPTFALPTWCSLVITELVVTVDITALGNGEKKEAGLFEKSNGTPAHRRDGAHTDARSTAHESEDDGEGHGKLWRKLTDVKETIKRLHGKINWIKLVDFIATAVEVNVVGVGSARLERLTLSVDTRIKTVDRSRLFQHHKTRPETQSPAEWKGIVRSLLFTADGRESSEILDYCTLNIHGMLHNELQGLRDASISLKLGRLNLPYDDIEHAKECADLLRGRYAQPVAAKTGASDVSLADAMQELEQPGVSHEERIVRTVSDSRAFIASILRGIQEVQFAVGFFGLSRRLNVKGDSGKDVYFNLAVKEVGLDVLRLDPKSPAHRMYFATNDVAHQGLLTAIAIAAGIDDGHEHPERMVYIPMVTATVKTTLPSRTIHYSRERENDAKDRNTNMLYANFVCTSPSVDLDPKHLPLMRELFQQTSKKRKQKDPGVVQTTAGSHRHHLISQLLPKAHVKLSIQEPVIRVSLPTMDRHKTERVDGDYDLLISSMSSMSFDLESSHAMEGGLHYSLSSHYRHVKHNLYYQTMAGDRHDLLQSHTVEVNLDVNAIPDPKVTASAEFRTFNIYLVRPDICQGVSQIVKQFQKSMLARSQREKSEKPKAAFLRTVPSWLEHVHIEGSEFGLELSGVDEQVSKDSRGFALQLDSWDTEYRSRREESQSESHLRRRSISRHTPSKEKENSSRHASPKRRYQSRADGRRLTFHLTNLEGFIVDSVADSEPEALLSLPRFEVAFTTLTDQHGPIFHVNFFAKSLLLQYSLYNHFAMGVAVMVIKKTFLDPSRDESSEQKRRHPGSRQSSTLHVPGYVLSPGPEDELDEIARHEITTFDFKTDLLQLKAKMPADPPMMVQIYGLDAGKHRWNNPFLRSRLARLYVCAPRTKAAWSRIVSIKSPRIDLRDVKRKMPGSGKQEPAVTEKSIDITTEIVRVTVPHGFVVHSIFDNIANVIKTTKQLQHHFLTGTNEYVLTKEPEGPKHMPRITLRSQMFVFDVEDSLFEWKLGAIYRAGLMEQKQRLARQEAFNLKEKRMARGMAGRGSSRFRAQSAHLGDRSRSRNRAPAQTQATKRRSQSTQPIRESTKSSQRQNRKKMRYDADGKCGISDTSQLTIEQAKEKLNYLNSQSWKNRIDRVMSFQSHTIREIRHMLWGLDEMPDERENQEPILALNSRPSLMLAVTIDLNLTVDKPSFPMEQIPNFLHDVGKGMPYDMKYGLLVPMNLHVTMGELRFQLRDYPLPLMHVPPIANGQSPRLQALSMRTDFVIAEEFRDVESQRHVEVEVIPPEKMSAGEGGVETPSGVKPPRCGFKIDVRRTISPVKTYSDMKFEINTSRSTKITWGTSYQPAIQDAMQVIEGFTKPPVDPSDRVGFWDKIRLSFHSRVNVAWKGDGDVNLILKGSRDPYNVTGTGAGLVMVWRNDVRWNIAQTKDPRQFMTVDSGDYILAVPDFNNYARRAHDEYHDPDGSSGASSTISSGKDAVFSKVVMKLSGNVRWLTGLVLERDLPGGKRLFQFKPHYDVVLKHPDFAKAPPGEEYDAYRDFRSHHIHMSIGISAPHDRDWNVSNLKASSNYNSVHLGPRFFSHFFSWWSMFSGVMSLPVRQGPLWGVTEKKSKKFGRHLATIKYNLLLSPLYIAHVYKHKDLEEYQENTVSATGLKMKIDSFMLDLHQRREHFDIKGHEDVLKKTSGMRINQAQLDFIHADLRALSATITGTSAEDIEKAADETIAGLHSQSPVAEDMSKFEIPDNDFTWIDMDDFVELDWILPAESNPETKILPVGYAPRFTYFRQTDHEGVIQGDQSRTSPFGDEPTHYCVMSAKNDPRRVQTELIERRLGTLMDQRQQNDRAIGEHEVKMVRDASQDGTIRQRLQTKLDMLRGHSEHLSNKQHFLQNMLNTLNQRLETDDPSVVPDLETSETFFEAHEHAKLKDEDLAKLDEAPLADYTSDFNNRFIVHNAQIKWNNSLRNIILRYIHQNSQRRGFVYYMSRRAIKFILDVLEERQNKESEHEKAHASGDGETPRREVSISTQMSATSPDVDDEQTIQDRIEQLLKDGRDWVTANEPFADTEQNEDGKDKAHEDISHDFTPLNTYHFRLIAPQVQLQSEKNPKSVVLVTAKGMQLKVIQIMDKDNVMDDVSGLVQRRFTAAADSLQMFVTSMKTFSTEFFHMYTANLYGAKAGTQWPPWVPMEIMFDFQVNPYGFSRVVHRTSASLRYDKYNNLRLKYNDDVSGGEQATPESAQEAEDRMDHVWIEFPQLRAICDSNQYYALYIIVMDLLLYNEPLEKTRTERLEKIMLASDFSDLRGAPEMVQVLQDRIRQLEEIKVHFQVNEKYLDRQGWKDRVSMDHELANCEDELFFMMKAITTSQQRVEDRKEAEDARGLMHLNMSAREIAWHLVREKDESLLEFQLKNASFDRTDNNDGSNHNVMEIGRINGYNLLPDALYPEIIAPFTDEPRGGRQLGNDKMLRIHWLMLEAIAGIPVVDYFEIDIVPLKVQVEREVAKKLFEYIFPGVGGTAFEGGGFSPFMVKNMLPTQEEKNEDGEDDKSGTAGTDTPRLSSSDSPDPEHTDHRGNGLGSLEHRLHPNLHLHKDKNKKQENKGLGISSGHMTGFTLFQHSDRSSSRQSVAPRSAASRHALSATNASSMSRSPSQRSLNTMASVDNDRGSKRTILHGSNSDEKNDRKKKRNEVSDDLTQMMSRASNYMTLATVKIPSVVLCLSYKGQGKRNLEDVHDLVFRLPTLEYRNKTWSNLDLALQLKKDVIRALISHAGAIVSNKLHRHQPKRDQQSRLREIVNSSTFVATAAASGNNSRGSPAGSDTSSLLDFPSETNGRPSTASARPSTLNRSISIKSTPATSSNERVESFEAPRPTTSRTQANGTSLQASPPSTRPISQQKLRPIPSPSSDGGGFDGARNRATSITRHLSGFGERLRQRSTNNAAPPAATSDHAGSGTDTTVGDAEENTRKRKLLLGGQKLLRTFRDQ
ncbi:hypothetical protein EJ03DRAFT_328998 [Teratosphaeria nubilosa]|uniref:Uncharacterized protein n=1 Tax=Teratosphaeria nubilosa TaxID=161662 RepID=A0A6G1L4N9_9PEZI|nr:hypothetical protein EJ03DRAFT_328998 [Teratosphaeria nubilosa]